MEGVWDGFVKEKGYIYPEYASQKNFSEFYDNAENRYIGIDQKYLQLLTKWENVVNRLLKRDFSLKNTTELLLIQNYIKTQKENILIKDKIAYLNFYNLAKEIYNNTVDSLKKGGKFSAINRFEGYIDPKGHKNIFNSTIDYLENKKVQNYNKDLIYPSKKELNIFLSSEATYSSKLKKFIKKLNISNEKSLISDYIRLQAEYKLYVKTFVLPKARNSSLLPFELLLNEMQAKQIEKNDWLFYYEKAVDEFDIVVSDFKFLQRELFIKYKIVDSSAFAALEYLSKQRLKNEEQVEKTYKNLANKFINKYNNNNLFKFSNLLNPLADIEYSYKGAPFTHYDYKDDKLSVYYRNNNLRYFDDYGHKWYIPTLIASEYFPGRALARKYFINRESKILKQFYNRELYEGAWSILATDLIYNDLTTEEKLFSLQRKGLKLLRFILSIQIHRNEVTEDEVLKIFVNQLGLTPELANIEYERISFFDPVSSMSEAYGYLKLIGFFESFAPSRALGKNEVYCLSARYLEKLTNTFQQLNEQREDFQTCLN